MPDLAQIINDELENYLDGGYAKHSDARRSLESFAEKLLTGVSVVSWHRYADRQPEDAERVFVQSADDNHWRHVVWCFYGNWTTGTETQKAHPDDLWCYLPTPPEGKP